MTDSSMTPGDQADAGNAVKNDLPDFELQTAADGMSIELEGRLACEDIEKNLPEIEARLKHLGVANLPSLERLSERLQASLHDGYVSSATLMEGRRPIMPSAPSVEWGQDFFNNNLVVDEKSGAVDYRRRQENLVVREGQLIARMQQAQPGRDGCDIFGKRVPVDKQTFRPLLKAVKNVRQEAKDGVVCFYATVDGRIRLNDNRLSVDNVVIMRNGINLETGDIVHSGSLIVHGDVKAGSSIEVEGDIEIMGTLEAADVRCGGCLCVRLGVTGDEKHKIVSEGDVHARFISNAVIEAEGNVITETEIVKSEIKTRGAILAPHGRIVGSKVTALGGIIADQAGSDGMIKTLLIAGVDYRLLEKVDAIKRQIAPLDHECKQKQARMSDLEALGKSMPAAQREELTLLMMEIEEIKESIKEMQNKIQSNIGHSNEIALSEIKIMNIIHAETTLSLAGLEKKIKTTRFGPVKAVVDNDEIVIRHE